MTPAPKLIDFFDDGPLWGARIDVVKMDMISYPAYLLVAFVGRWAFACSLVNGIGTAMYAGVEVGVDLGVGSCGGGGFEDVGNTCVVGGDIGCSTSSGGIRCRAVGLGSLERMQLWRDGQ
eukprot:10264731-Ditylum_brightwellii.AAC.1